MHERNSRDLGGLAWVVLYLMFSVVMITVVVASAAVGAALLLMLTSGGDGMAVLQELIEGSEKQELPAWFMALVTTVQFPTMLLAAVATRAGVRFVWYRSNDLDDDMSWRDVFALRRSTAVALALGTLMGFTTGWLPGWFAGWMRETFPSLQSGALDLINNALTQGPLGYRLIIAFWVAIGAAAVEELVFRGFLWEGLRRTGIPMWGVWVASSVIFAAYHMDPVQSTALLFTALVLGWVRWRSDSILPAIALHAVNNSLGVAGALMGAQDSDMPLALAATGAAVSVALCYVMFRFDDASATPATA